ncbi:unnamed protein product [Linum trigynum]|uniref:Chalcone-flavonone isomerase family protein n=1 Tax=Linum trigynum TaxID=586398 RepID=A0AAV2DM95_9ROSI
MTVKVGYAVDVKEDTDETVASQSSSAFPTCIIRLVVRYRYQLRFASNEGKLVVLEDVVTPELATTLRVPIASPISLWQELYLADALKKSNLIESGLRAVLQRKIADSAETISKGKTGSGGGFAMVVKVGILKDEILSTEERDRIAKTACGWVNRDRGGGKEPRLRSS